MAFNSPFNRGKDVVLRIYQDGKAIYIAAKNWDVTENAVEVADGVNGEQRDRLDKVTNFFSCSVDIFQTDMAIVKKMMEAQAADDASALPLVQTAAVQIKNRDGTRNVFLLKECKFGPLTLTESGRSDAFMLNLKIRCRFFEEAQSVSF